MIKEVSWLVAKISAFDNLVRFHFELETFGRRPKVRKKPFISFCFCLQTCPGPKPINLFSVYLMLC